MKPKILFVDDEPNVLASYGRILREHWEVVTADGGEAGLKALETSSPVSVVVSDFQMPRMNGIKFLAKVRDQYPDIVRMMLTGEGGYEVAIHAVNEGNIFRLMTKPCPPDQLVKALEAGMEQYRLVQAEKEARAKEVRIAFEIQKNLLMGKHPEGIRGCQLASSTVPSAGVDGDFIDFLDHSDTCLDIVIGDVMGKGIPAAMIGAGAKSRFARVLARLYARRSDGITPQPEAIFQQVNDEISGHLEEMGSYITGCYARFDFEKKQFTFVDAGHPPTLYYSRRRDISMGIKGDFFPLGFPMSIPYKQNFFTFETGDVFLFYSDGLLDCGPSRDKMFGLENIENGLLELKDGSAEEILQGLIARATAFNGSSLFGDDLTLVVVKITDL
jgi:serine phosphatase RsbU (regulator of sigma subunit)